MRECAIGEADEQDDQASRPDQIILLGQLAQIDD